MAKIRGEELVARCLEREGVKSFFFMMGSPTSGTAGASMQLGMQGIYVRHEQAAAMAAHAYARVRGEAGVCITPSGPGTANAVTGLANAWADSSPIVAVGGSAPIQSGGMDAFQEMDQLAMLKPVVKAAYRVERPELVPRYVSTAFREALEGKRGPVYLDLPADVLMGSVDEERVEWSTGTRAASRAAGDPTLVEAAIALLASAERPLVVTGSGVLWSQASDALRGFVEATEIPVYMTPQGRGAVPDDHPLAFPAARSLAFREADVVLVVGARANAMLSYLRAPRFAAAARFVVVNVDSAEIGHNRAVEVGIVGDARLVLEQLSAAAEGRFSSEPSAWCAKLADKQQSNEERAKTLLESNAIPIHPLRLCAELRDLLPRDAYLVVDGHEILNFARQSIPIYEPGTSLNAGPHGCMGIGIPFGLGAKVARPNRTVVVLSGDGAFGWNGMEMDSAIRHDLPIVVVMSNNAGFTSRQTGGSIGRELGFQRYDLIVAALGGHGEFVEKPEEIRAALERAFASGKPALVNVCTDPEAQSQTDVGFAGY